jgi:hypothetical protein
VEVAGVAVLLYGGPPDVAEAGLCI